MKRAKVWMVHQVASDNARWKSPRFQLISHSSLLAQLLTFLMRLRHFNWNPRWRPWLIVAEVIKSRQSKENSRENGKFPTHSEKNVNIGNASCASRRSIGYLWLSMMESWPMIMVSTLFGFRWNCFDSPLDSLFERCLLRFENAAAINWNVKCFWLEKKIARWESRNKSECQQKMSSNRKERHLWQF